MIAVVFALALALTDPAQTATPVADLATWQAFLAKVSNDSDVPFFNDTLHIQLARTGESLDPSQPDSFINYKDASDRAGATFIRQWGVHGVRINFTAAVWSLDGEAASGRPCLTLKDFRTAAEGAGWSEFAPEADSFTHGFSMKRDNLDLKLEAGGGEGLHFEGGYKPEWSELADCAAGLTISTAH